MYDNEAMVTVAQLYVDDLPLNIKIWQSGVEADRDVFGTRARFAYEVVHNGLTVIKGDDLYGPATGLWPEAADMAVTLASFLSAASECGEITEHGESYPPETHTWLIANSERLGLWAADMEESEA
jgi:hypothetical protein